MPARTGREYLQGLRDQEREVWLGGERVKDVTMHPGLRRGAQAIAELSTTCSTTPRCRRR
ncbi:MAG TPA: 4-hydroxyphenylacetate 3-hydroxylase N-terminal domain-containing protein [Vicinamibacteria bacterium]|nr:4-hydroxyphenylacetate 3-hydroxylase N-terminal domain-containing protein [Vicinamibacteria bacterium]